MDGCLQRFKLVEVLGRFRLGIFALGWALHRGDWASQLGPGLLPCLAALGIASLAILGLGAAWDYCFSAEAWIATACGPSLPPAGTQHP